MRPAALLAALLTTVVAVGVPAAPASADPQITLDPVTRAGHVTGTLSGVPAGTAYVRFRLDYSAVQSDNVPVVDGQASFDLPTWGYREPSVNVGTCTGPEASSCSPNTVLATSQPFLAKDVDPSVTWSDRTLTGAQALTATVSDPDGGGDLRVLWRPEGDGADRTGILARTGTTTVSAGEGRGVLRVFRCATGNQYACQQRGADVPVERDGTVSATAFVDPAVVRGTAPSASLHVRVSDPGDWTVDWTLEDPAGATVTSGTRTVTVAPSSNLAGVTMPLPGDLAAGTYRVSGTASRASAAGDAFPSSFATTFAVDTTAPVTTVGSASPQTFFPAGDGYLDTTTVPVTVSDERSQSGLVDLEVRDAQDTVVGTEQKSISGSGSFTWDGQTSTGALLPAGTYRLRARATDPQGNVGAWSEPTSVTLDRRQLVQKQWTKVVTAGGSLVSKAAGRCSRVRIPSLRASWSGSIGLESGSRCRTTSTSANSAATVHGVALPSVVGSAPDRLESIEIGAYGGAAKATPRSTALLRYRLADGGYVASRTLASSVATRYGPAYDPTTLLRTDRTVRWRLDVGNRARYDVKAFRVILTYSVLQ